jgi:methylmalonyl-CoA mutase N-terminal domain/subunit
MFDEDDLQSIREGREEWDKEIRQPTLDRFGERKEAFTTDTNGHAVDPLYTPADIAALDYDDDISFPGEEP